jgi:hypothetical protein
METIHAVYKLEGQRQVFSLETSESETDERYLFINVFKTRQASMLRSDDCFSWFLFR